MIEKIAGIVKPIYHKFDTNFYQGHIKPVFSFSKILAENYGGDINVVYSSALVHDIGLALHGAINHNISGKQDIVNILTSLDYNPDIIGKILNVVKNHNMAHLPLLTIEDEILRSADAMAHISEMSYTFFSFLLKSEYSEAKILTRESLISDMKDKITLPFAKEYIQESYNNAIMLLK